MNVLMEALRQRGDIASVAQLGSRVHALLAPGAHRARKAVKWIAAYLEAEGLKHVGGEVAEPNLEDALVAITQGEHLEAGGRRL